MKKAARLDGLLQATARSVAQWQETFAYIDLLSAEGP